MSDKKKNRLADELSPYLQQHAGNPVDWFPWGDEAFEEARKRNVPIFLSIGYSTCHWCHVMEEDSFSNPEVAQLLNRAFVPIKVDREERPDIDNIYMEVCQVMTGQGGWPLTIIMTPEKKPFHAATFIPSRSRYGLVGMVDLIPRIEELWNTRRDELEKLSIDILRHLQKVQQTDDGDVFNRKEIINRAVQELQQSFDAVNGGFGTHPKFPTPQNLLFLMNHEALQKQSVKPVVEKTLNAMASGGLYDHLGFGFHRYSTDARWQVPHFEKMLYDQAMLILAYSEAALRYGSPFFEQKVDETVKFLKDEMLHTAGPYYSAIDADSEGREGKFYIWDYHELQLILEEEELDFLNEHFGLTEEGNFSDPHNHSLRSNVLYVKKSFHDDTGKIKTWETIRTRLYTKREERIKPFKDTKILADWNGLLTAALARAGRQLQKPEYIDLAERAASFVLKEMTDEKGRLFHLHMDGNSRVTAFLPDYAYMIYGLLELYRATFDVTYLEQAVAFQEILDEEFLDTTGGGYYQNSHESEELLIRKKETYDGPYPSGNAVAMYNLFRLYKITGNEKYEKNIEAMTEAFGTTIGRSPSAYTQWVTNLLFMDHPFHEIVVAGQPGDEETEKILKTLNELNLPNMVVILKTEENSEVLAKISPFTEHQKIEKGSATVYVCSNFSCQKPVTSAEEIIKLLAK
jgi:uncharacterized protein YyaL (SSP411 family)